MIISPIIFEMNQTQLFTHTQRQRQRQRERVIAGMKLSII